MCVCAFVGLATINSFYARETLKDSKKIDIRPEMLEVRKPYKAKANVFENILFN